MTDAAEWQGDVGRVWAAEWCRTDRAFAGIAAALDRAILAAAPAGAFAALDIGSGAGTTSLALAAARPEARITGVDLSKDRVRVARQRVPSAASAHLSFCHGDALDAAAELAPLDLIFSRHGVMFFGDPVAAFVRLQAAARPGARLVFSCFRSRGENPWAGGAADAVAQTGLPAATDAPGPFAFAQAERVDAILAAAGWRDAAAIPVDTVFRVGGGEDPVGDAVAFFRRIGSAASLLRALDPAERTRARERLADFAAAHRIGDTIDFPAAAWIWTATA
ncbi:MAG: class I SAM-dependent methyltransferase [Pseudomonadota bacterium]